MEGSGETLSVPYARLQGEWDVLRRTGDGRTTVAVREDEKAGVALGYPYAEDPEEGDELLKVAALRNVRQDYVLVSASFVSIDALDELVPEDCPRQTVDLARYNRLSNETVTRLLADGDVVVLDVGEEQWYPGAIQKFDDVDAARETWLQSLPRVRDRLVAIDRVLNDVGLHQVAAARSSGPSVHSP